MTRNVTYATLIRSFADGKIVEFQDSYVAGAGWYALEADNTEVLPYFLRTDGHTEGRFQFRLKPHTVKIGGREVEAPVLRREEGQRLWYVNTFGEARELADNSVAAAAISRGQGFSSPEAALIAADAITALLRGEA